MNNVFALQAPMLPIIRAGVPEFKTVGGLSVLLAVEDPLELLPGCFVNPTRTVDGELKGDLEGPKSMHPSPPSGKDSLKAVATDQYWQVSIVVRNVIVPDDSTNTETTAGLLLWKTRKALIEWEPDLATMGGRMRPSGIVEPVYYKGYTSFSAFFRQAYSMHFDE